MSKRIPARQVRRIVTKALGDGARAARQSVEDSLAKFDPKKAPLAPVVPAVRRPAEPGARRTPEQIEQTARAVLAVIRANPGIIPERIVAVLNTVVAPGAEPVKSGDLTRPLRLLVAPPAPMKARAQVSGRKRYSRYTALVLS